jgi:hypothetical protein
VNRVDNDVLLWFIIAAIGVSLGGTLVAVGMLNQFSEGVIDVRTGFAVSGEGNVSVEIPQRLSITTVDGPAINFSGCRPGRTISSATADGNDFGDCPGFVPQAILVRNDGTYQANITVTPSDWGEAHGGTFLDASSDDSWIAYRITNTTPANSSFLGGCLGTAAGWTNFTDGSEMPACDLLAAGTPRNSFSFDVAIFVPATTASRNNSVSFLFLARAIP